jgi:hypothetical protein
MMMTELDDWRTPMLRYLENPSHIAHRNVVHDNTLYHRTIDDLLLKCLGSGQSKIAMRGS